MTDPPPRSRLPDALSVGRILLVPVMVWLLARVGDPSPTDAARVAAVGTWVVIGLSDLLDGVVARRLSSTTVHGAVLDAAADKLATLLPLFYWALVRPDPFPPVPLWLPVALLVLDVALTAAWVVGRLGPGEDPEARHNQGGRIATLVAFLLVGGVAAGIPAAVVAPAGAVLVGLRLLAVGGYVRAWLL